MKLFVTTDYLLLFYCNVLLTEISLNEDNMSSLDS